MHKFLKVQQALPSVRPEQEEFGNWQRKTQELEMKFERMGVC